MLDINSPAVSRLLAEIQGEITRSQGSLERLGKTPSEYDVIRGRIKGLRQVVNLIKGNKEDETSG